ncbi:MAG: FimB/Mfa2 family fimbrial subunit [Tannerella sp.]|nr:FimB/Mfa2 family fimbrial subunit [Tannerella sp.]
MARTRKSGSNRKCVLRAGLTMASVAVAAMLLLGSCIGDKLEPCPPGATRVFFPYERALRITSQADSIGVIRGIQPEDMNNLSQMDLYIFDAETDGYLGKYTDLSPGVGTTDRYSMTLVNLAPGRYKFVAWGGLKRTDYAVAPVTPVEQVSTFRDFSVNYMFTGDTVTADIDKLFYGVNDNVVIVGGDSVDVPLRQDTYTFNITLGGTAVTPDDQFRVAITDNNNHYDFSNAPITAPKYTYLSYFHPVVNYADDETYEVTTTRRTLLVDRDREPIMRIYRNGETWRLRGYEEGINLVALVLNYEKRGIHIDFSAMYEFDIRITVDGNADDYTSMSVNVEIGDWKVTSNDTELF